MQRGMQHCRTLRSDAQLCAAIASPVAGLAPALRQRCTLQSAARRPLQTCCCQAAERPLQDAQPAAARQADWQAGNEGNYAAGNEGNYENYMAGEQNDMEQYGRLKEDMNRTTRRFAAFVSGYILLTSTSDVAVCTALGSAFGYAYLQLLMRDVDAFGQDDATAAAFLMQEDSSLELAALSSAKKIVAAYRAALRPRLLVLVALVGAAAAYSSLAPEPLNGLQASALLGGFLTYKAGQFGQIWDATRPKFEPEALTRPPRPNLASAEDEELEEVDTEEWKRRLRGKPY